MADYKAYRAPEEQDSNVMGQVRDLIKFGKSDYAVLQKLRQAHKDEDVVNKIFDAYKERLDHITKKARKFRQIIMDKYGPMNLSYDQLIHKAKKYQRALKLSDDEFNMFVSLSLTDRSATNLFSLPTTPLAKTLGYEASMAVADRLNVRENEMDTVQEILKLYGESKVLHSQIVLQSLSYEDMAAEALSGTYDHSKHNVFSHVHPIIAAMFLPRIAKLDEQMLIANLGHIVKCKYEGRHIMTKPDFLLYWDLISDPNEQVCSSVSPIKDLKNRFFLQTKLWDCVLNLRGGRYYVPALQDFLAAIDACRSNIYDAPDMTYVKDEGSILRRLLSAFSLRPTMVSTMRMFSSYPGFSYGAYGMAMGGMAQPTNVSMITYRLPMTVSPTGVGMVPSAPSTLAPGAAFPATPSTVTAKVSLTDALSQAQWFIENK